MKRLIRKATRTNLWFFAVTWFIGLWAAVRFFTLWPKITWLSVREIIFVLVCVALCLLIAAFFQSRIRCTNKRQRMQCRIAAQQQRFMAFSLLLAVGMIMFIVLLNHALCV